jgi:hypothetical protein
MVFLGIEFDTLNMIMKLPSSKLGELRETIQNLTSPERVVAPGRVFVDA